MSGLRGRRIGADDRLPWPATDVEEFIGGRCGALAVLELCVDVAGGGRPLVAAAAGRMIEAGASRIGENVDIAEVGRSCLAASDAFLCAAIASFSEERLPAALTLPVTPGPTLTVKADAVLPAFGFAGSFSRSCLLFASRLFMMLSKVSTQISKQIIVNIPFCPVRPDLCECPVRSTHILPHLRISIC